jgi:hypothetical protein
MTLDIVGGVYTERCAFPYWNEIYGSGGRAAVALASQGVDVRLHTLLSADDAPLAQAVFPAKGVDLSFGSRDAEIVFDYLHSLSVPRISPRRSRGQFDETLTGKIIVKFGMLEADPTVSADVCVYDPQSAFSPKMFGTSGSKAKRLAVIANRSELLKMTATSTVDEAVRKIVQVDGAEIVVVKNGLHGATVHSGELSLEVPAFKTSKVFTIGSGDVFVAAFALAWAVRGESPGDAAMFASLATAEYVESRDVMTALSDDARNKPRDKVSLAGGEVYLAGPFREVGQRMLVDDAFDHLTALGMDVFSPIHHIGPGEASAVVAKDLEAVRRCDAVFAILNGSSPGTVFEVGYACALDKQVFCLAQNLRQGDLKLPLGAGAYLSDDFVTALFHIAWRS